MKLEEFIKHSGVEKKRFAKVIGSTPIPFWQILKGKNIGCLIIGSLQAFINVGAAVQEFLFNNSDQEAKNFSLRRRARIQKNKSPKLKTRTNNDNFIKT